MEDIVVLKVIDNKTLVINRGKEDGIRNDDKFLVYKETGDDVFDIKTNEDLGRLEIVVGTAKVKHIQSRMTTLVCADEERIENKRVIKRRGYHTSFITEIEEITEPEITELEFENPVIGDKVKKIN